MPHGGRRGHDRGPGPGGADGTARPDVTRGPGVTRGADGPGAAGGPGSLAPRTSPVALPAPGAVRRAASRAVRGLRAAGFDPRGAWSRTVGSLPAVLQLVLAVTASYLVTHVVLGHEVPLLAITVTLSSLGLARVARPAQVLETAVGIVTGIALSELLRLLLGTGVWQVVVVLTVVLVAGRFASPSAGFTIAAATQSMLVMLLPDPDGGPFVRSVDGAVGGLVALAVTALVPRGAAGAVRAEARALAAELDRALVALVAALRADDVRRADEAVRRLRGTQPALDRWGDALDAAVGVARLSPFLRRRLSALRAQVAVRRDVDHAVRNLRVVARRVDTSLGDGRDRSVVADLLDGVRSALVLLVPVDDGREPDPEAARATLERVAGRLDPTVVAPGAPVTEQVLVLMLRPLVVDLLMATGEAHAAARARLAPLPA